MQRVDLPWHLWLHVMTDEWDDVEEAEHKLIGDAEAEVEHIVAVVIVVVVRRRLAADRMQADLRLSHLAGEGDRAEERIVGQNMVACLSSWRTVPSSQPG